MVFDGIHPGGFERETLTVECNDYLDRITIDNEGCYLIGYIWNDLLEEYIFDEEAQFSAIISDVSMAVTNYLWVIHDRYVFPAIIITQGLFEIEDEATGIVAERPGYGSGYSLSPPLLGEKWLMTFNTSITKLSYNRARERRFENYDFSKLGRGLFA